MHFLYLFLVVFFSQTLYANSNSFILGEDDQNWGLIISPSKDSQLQLKLGTRLQTVTSLRSRKDSTTDDLAEYNDFYIRRGRFQVEAKYNEGIKFYMDIRNDDANKEDKGEGDFNIGDAYIETQKVFGKEGLKFRAFRAKVDVSRSETISSSKLLFLDRAHVADEAAQFVSHNRRASNVQLLGSFDKWYFQFVLGDGVQKDKFQDAKGNKLSSGAIDGQKFMIGGKLRLYPFAGWEDKQPTETYFGRGKHFSFGVGSFHTDSIKYRNSNVTQIDSLSRTLTNVEMSFHYRNLSFQSEYFKFNGVLEDLTIAEKRLGSSDGFYVHSEYIFPEISYLAPFIRFEKWDKFNQEDNYNLISQVAGLNWYLKGNKIRLGLFYQYDKFDKNLRSANKLGETFEDDKQVKLTSMWHY